VPGRYYEDFEVDQEFVHSVARTVTETDNILNTSMTMNVAPVHLDAEYNKSTIHGQRLVPSLYTLGLVVGISAPDLDLGTTKGDLGYETVTFPHPVFHGDTLRVESTVMKKRESKSHPDAGIVWFEHRGINQRDEIVTTCQRVAMIFKRPTTD
jgi:acyl dehydratase